MKNLTQPTSLMVAVCIGMLCLMSATAQAQGIGSDRADKAKAQLQKRFVAADTNADGRLSRDEAKAGMPRLYEQFDRIDTEKTGSITQAQIVAFVSQQRGF